MTIEQDVKNWLADEGVFREKAADENADFHFVIEFPKDNVMDVVKPKEKDVIVIGCATQVAPEHIRSNAKCISSIKKINFYLI